MNDRHVLTDDLLRRALAARMAHTPDLRLLDRIVAGAGVVDQHAAPGGRLARRLARGRWGALPTVGAAAVVIVGIIVVAALRGRVDGPGGTPSPRPSPTHAQVSGAPATPESLVVDGHGSLRLALGAGTDPIDTIVAFDSVWTADIHGNDVRRFDPATLAQQARIGLPPETGPAWLIATPSEIWVTNQLGSGLTRVDPATNTVVGIAGAGPTCGAPFVALDSIWQAACDANTFLRLDPGSGATLDTIPAGDHHFLVGVGDRLITSNANGLAVLAPDTGVFTALPGFIPGYRDPAGFSGQLFASDGTSVWIATDAGPARVDATSGRVIVTFPYPDAQTVTFAAGHAWLVVDLVGVIQIDLASNQVVQTIRVFQSPLVAREADGSLWVTDFDNSQLWRIEP